MGLDNLSFRHFRWTDALLLEDTLAPKDMTALAGSILMDGAVVAYAGMHPYESRHFLFFQVADTPRGELLRTKAPVFLARLLRDLLKKIVDSGIEEIHVLCDDRIARSRDLLKTLGFARVEYPAWDLLIATTHAGMDVWVYKTKKA